MELATTLSKAGAGNDLLDLYGNQTGDDILRGGDGDDFLGGYIGSDAFSGGAGNDSALDVSVVAVLTDTNYTSDSLVSANHGVESWQLVGTVGNDTIDASAWTGAGVFMDGGEGDDVLKGGSGNDDLRGGPGDDDISPGLGQNTVFGGDGNDIMRIVTLESDTTINVTASRVEMASQGTNYSDIETIRLTVLNPNAQPSIANDVTATIIITGLAPVVTASRQGNSVVGSFIDRDSLQGWTGTIDLGTGQGPVPLPLSPNQTFEYALPSTVGTITIRISDSDGNVASPQSPVPS